MSTLILSASEMRELEQRAFAEGVDQEELMDLAGGGIASEILRLEPRKGICILYLGRGNNAGDALVAGSVLQNAVGRFWSDFRRLRIRLVPCHRRNFIPFVPRPGPLMASTGNSPLDCQ
jgi:hypothetical protein